ncbi:EAL domain-containing protein [Alteromonas aestuariivivens]|uniref:EAL domain-containing protein n=2 Tax=Alteromonas aestuariivivens TaxID=1938339 RepID=A0A3D8M7H9_9ALTE|nr:EAL domain-containing protein [Alteromonas aestuariivivens]
MFKLALVALVVIFCSVWSIPATAQNLVLNTDNAFRSADLQPYISSAIAPKNQAYLKVFHQQNHWHPDYYLSPLPADHRLWYQVHLAHNGNKPIRLVLRVDRLSLDQVSMMVLDERERIIHSASSSAEKDSSMLSGTLPSLDFPLEVQPEQQVTLLVSIADPGLVSFPFRLWQQEALEEHDDHNLILFGVAVGTLGILFGYFFISYLYQRTAARFWLSLSNLLFVGLIVCEEGLFIKLLPLANYAEHILTALVALVMFTLAKVTHSLFTRLPTQLRLLNYLPSIAGLVLVATNAPYLMTAGTFALAAIGGLLQLFYALFYRDRRNKALSRIFMVAWGFLFALLAMQISVMLDGKSLSTAENLYMALMLMFASLSFGVSVELKERNANFQRLLAKERTISNLHYFYDLFRNSAEGLFTSTLEGQLKSVNPAMCSLFGYADEATMLAAVSNTKMLYVRGEDRDLLIGEILEHQVVMGREIKGKRADGSEFWFSISCQLRQEEGDNYLYGSIFDITERKQSDISLEYLATHDSLTGVYNRREFEQQLHQLIEHPKPHNAPVILLYLDLDRFKVVNDTCGHKAGDALIKEVAQLLQNTLDGKGILARLGGDEFAVLFKGHQEDAAYLYGVKMLNAVQSYRFIWENRIFTLGVSIGMLNCSQYEASGEQMMSMADAACYIAKEQGRNQIHRYSSDDESLKRYEQELDWVSSINRALEENGFVLFYQHFRPLNKPIDGDYYEIMLRMQGDDGELVPPNAFLPSAERYNLNANIDRWVVENTFKWLAGNPEHLASLKRCNINLSGHSLANRELKLFILNAFEKYAIPYSKVCFEITETMAIIKMEDTLQFVRTFKQLGCLFALDDFGSGFSSYTYLKHLPINTVKIDGSFVCDMLNDPVDLAMVSSIKDVAKALGMDTVAEFVESEATMVELGRMGVDYAQGIGVAEPAPLSEFKSL